MTAATLMGCGGESAKTESDFTTVDPAQPVSDWQLVWSDDFDGSAIDSAKWTHEVNWNHSLPVYGERKKKNDN